MEPWDPQSNLRSQAEPPASEPGTTTGCDRDYSFGPFVLSVPIRELRRDDTHVPLPPTAFDVLVALVERCDRVVSKEELIRLAWGETAVSDDSLTQSIKALRRALGDDATQPAYITTIARRGYRFVAAVHRLPRVAPDDARTAQVSGEPLAGPHTPNAPQRTPAAPREGFGAVPIITPRVGRDERRRGARILVMGIALAAVVLTAALGLRALPLRSAATPAAALPTIRLPLALPDGLNLRQGGALSGDGRLLAYVAARTGQRASLWLADLESGQTRQLATDGEPSRPFLSANGHAVAYFADGALKIVDVAGGPSRTLASVRNGSGGSWGPDGRLLFADLRGPILVVGEGGAPPKPLTTLDRGRQEVAHELPQMLPGGTHFLYVVRSQNPDAAGTYIGAFDSPLKQRLVEEPAVYASGHLLFVRQDTLLAQTVDLEALTLTGEPVAVAVQVATPDITLGTTLAASSTGIVAYSGGHGRERLAWFGRSGQRLPSIDAPEGLYNPRLSANGRQVFAAARAADGPNSIWAVDLDRGVPTRITQGMRPVPSPDGTHVAFTSDLDTGVTDIYVRSLVGGDANALVVRSDENKLVDDWAPDGMLVYTSTNASTKADLYTVSSAGTGEPAVYLRTPFNELQARVSPDGRWVAYASDESGTFEVHIQSFPTPGAKRTVSVGGGTEPRWSPDGRELSYLARDGAVMVVSVVSGRDLQLGRPSALFRPPDLRTRGVYFNNYDLAPDGRFLFLTADTPESPSIRLVFNWQLTPP
ncbi:MAG: winged helix-turn-helix domain-containing protein [Vicinamibacterales bacterium]